MKKTTPKDHGALAREPAVTSYLVAQWLVDQGWDLRSVTRNPVFPSDLWARGEDRLTVLAVGRYSLLSGSQRTTVSLTETPAALQWLTRMGAGAKKSDPDPSDPVPPGRPTG